MAVGSAWTAIFHRPTWREVLLAIACVPVVFGMPVLVALFVVGSQHLTPNQMVQATGHLSPVQALGFFSMSAVQLLGEELVTLLPFLVLLTALRRTTMKPWVALCLTWFATSLMFGALHLPTYGWNFAQALLVIGTARLVLTGVYVLTKNVWASTITHIGNDWMLFTIAMLTL
ncbi:MULTISPECIES: CPBP family intramembrane glutamic endopeptidase [Stenotrophomonas]|nr:CPBP family intramembrane glutamic endopeptidase [Stenotrophomonas maltophilia]